MSSELGANAKANANAKAAPDGAAGYFFCRKWMT